MALSKESPLDVDGKDHSLILMRSLDLMRKERQGCDLTIKVDGEEIQVHRVVMSAMSDYFKAMFAHDTVENRSGVVEMKGVGFKFMKKGVEHIYGGKVSISEDDCEDFLVMATMVQLPLLCEKIQTFLASRLSPTKFFKFKKIADKFSCKNLVEACNSYAFINLGAISKEEEYQHLEVEYISFLMKSETSLYTQDAKFSIFLRWINADIVERSCHLTTLMSLLNLEGMSLQYKGYLAKNEPTCFNSAECLKMLLLASVNNAGIEPSPAEVPFSGENNCVLGFDRSCGVVKAYRPELKSWTEILPLHKDMLSGGYTAVVVEKFLFVLMKGRKTYMINIMEKDSEWVRMKDMLKDHFHWLKAAVLDSIIYVAGKSSMECYSVCKNEWKTIDSNEIVVRDSGLIDFGGYVCNIGGYDGAIVLNSVNKFSPKSSEWFPVEPMHFGRQNSATAVHNAKIYVAGGYCHKSLSQVESYDPNIGVWVKLGSMTTKHDLFTLQVVGGKIFAVGSRENPQVIEEYEFDKDQWNFVEELPNENLNIVPQATVAVWLPV